MTSCSDRCRPGSPCMVSRDGICEQPARVYVPTTARRKAELTAIAETQGIDLPTWASRALADASGMGSKVPGLAEQHAKLRAAIACAHRLVQQWLPKQHAAVIAAARAMPELRSIRRAA